MPLKLKSLELCGFKSFAKKTIFTFDNPITAIVGPNGSGKSNVAEAFRWVLGEQSLKSLRGKRGEDLIFHGSHSVGRINRASVILTFDNRDRFIPVEFDEISVEREVHADGENNYLINKSKVRLKDIVEKLSSAGLGPTGHYIVSQGESDRILRASPRDRQSMVEDALSLKIYHLKITESEHKLERTLENLKQAEALRKEIAPHLNFLGKQLEKIKQADNLKQELIAVFKQYLSCEKNYIESEKKKILKEREGPREEILRTEEEMKTCQGSDWRGISKELAETRREKENCERQIGRIEGMLEVKEEIIRNDNSSERQIPFPAVNELISEIEGKINKAENQSEISVIKNAVREIKEAIKNFIYRFNASHSSDTAKENIKNLKEEKEKYFRMLVDVKSREKEMEEDLALRREAEKKIYEIKSRRNELSMLLESLNSREGELLAKEKQLKEKIDESIAITGHRIFKELNELNMAERCDRTEQEQKARQIERLKIRLEESGQGGGDVEKEYGEASKRDSYLSGEIEDLKKAEQSLRELIEELQNKLTGEFKEGIDKINKYFQDFFSIMFGGGNASIAVMRRKDDETTDEDESGLEIEVSLPRKKIRGIHTLSGGERVLTSIALLFAVSQVNPPPFLVLDETDAALDEANSRRYGDMIENLSKHSQLVVITHNRETMSRAGVLYGVTMGADSVSRLLSIRLDEAVATVK